MAAATEAKYFVSTNEVAAWQSFMSTKSVVATIWQMFEATKTEFVSTKSVVAATWQIFEATKFATEQTKAANHRPQHTNY